MDDNKKRDLVDEWFLQADYDYDTAMSLFSSSRYIYAIFICHLSLEKALKAIYIERLAKLPPKTHNLIYLIDTMQLEVRNEDDESFNLINDVSVLIRYPQDLKALLGHYGKEETEEVLNGAKKVIEWIKTQSEVLSSK